MWLADGCGSRSVLVSSMATLDSAPPLNPGLDRRVKNGESNGGCSVTACRSGEKASFARWLKEQAFAGHARAANNPYHDNAHPDHAHHGHDTSITSVVLRLRTPTEGRFECSPSCARAARFVARQRHSQSPRGRDTGRDQASPLSSIRVALPSGRCRPPLGMCSLPAARARRGAALWQAAARRLRQLLRSVAEFIPRSVVELTGIKRLEVLPQKHWARGFQPRSCS